MSKTTTQAAARRTAYSLAAAAGMTGVATAQTDATVSYSGEQDISIGQFSSQLLNLDGDAYDDILLKNYVFVGGNYQGAYVNFAPGKVVGFNAGLNYVSALSAGDSIDAAATASGSFSASMAYGANNPNAEFNDIESGYIGLEFPINAVSHYGWVRVSVDNAAGTFVVHDWAYETVPGAGLTAGEIPEPTSLGLLAAGAAGIAAMRKRRQK